MNSLKTALLALFTCSAAALCGQGEPSDPLAYAPADSNVAVVVNVRQLLVADGFIKKGLEKATSDAEKKRQYESKLKVVQNLTGMNPMTDLETIAIWGKIDRPESFAVRVAGKFDEQKVLALLQTNRQFRTTSEPTGMKVTVYVWEAKARKDQSHSLMDLSKYGAFLEDGSMVIFNSIEAVKSAVAAKESGKHYLADGAPAEAGSPWIPTKADGTAIWAHMKKPASANKFKDTLQAESLDFTLRLNDADVYSTLTVNAASPEAAQGWLEMIQGVKAFATLQSTDPKPKYLADRSKVELDKNQVRLTLSVPNDVILSQLKKRAGAKGW